MMQLLSLQKGNNMPTKLFQKGHIPWSKGKTLSKETKEKISNTLKRKGIKPKIRYVAFGKDHWFWKGNNVSYSGLHHWIERILGKPTYCNLCHKAEGKFEWANISHKYKRDPKDFMSLCYSCHDKYDNVRKKEWYTRRKNGST